MPTVGETVIGDLSGTINSKEVGPEGNTGPRPILGTGWVNSLELKWELTTKIWALDVSLIPVALNLMSDCDSSRGGRTPTALQGSLNSLPIPDLQISSSL